jgi:hypothetical protein
MNRDQVQASLRAHIAAAMASGSATEPAHALYVEVRIVYQPGAHERYNAHACSGEQLLWLLASLSQLPIQNQYYFRNTHCFANSITDRACTCWHDEGHGPFPHSTPKNDSSLHWRKCLPTGEVIS